MERLNEREFYDEVEMHRQHLRENEYSDRQLLNDMDSMLSNYNMYGYPMPQLLAMVREIRNE